MNYLSPVVRIALRTRFAVAQAARVGWYASTSIASTRLAERVGRSLPPAKRPTITAPAGIPDRATLLRDVQALLARDLANVEAGLYPMPEDEPGGILGMFERRARFLADVPEVVRRRRTRAHQEVPRTLPGRPRYYMQNFHFQSDGWLSDNSAALYDTQVETLFFGAAAAMRRQGLVPIAHEVRRRDQRRMRLVDIGSGTGAFVREVARAFPRLPAVALDLSEAYLRHARAHIGGRPSVAEVVGNAEALPLADASVDIAASAYLFHELPQKARLVVAREMARVTKPGGLLLVVDSLQTGDRPEFDGLLELFPQLFHEPYYQSYCAMDLPAAFTRHGVALEASWTAFVSKVFVFRKP